MKFIDNIPLIQYLNLKEYEDKRNSILFTSRSAYETSKPFIHGLKISSVFYINSSVTKEVNKNAEILISEKNKVKICYAVGGGMVADVAKFYAYKMKLPLIIIPTMISTDAFLVNCTGLRENGCVVYVPTKKAEKILIDFSLLEKAPLTFHLSGCGDILSIFTGLFDWKYTNKEKKQQTDEIYSASVEKMAQGILNGLIKEKREIKNGSRKGLEAILGALIMEVQLCNNYGNSRPEEGGEHFFTYCVENKMPHFLHGEMVSFGILITAFLQNQNWEKIRDFMDYIGLNYIPKGLTEKIILETLTELPEYVKTHNLRYSVYNKFSLKDNEKHLEKFIKYIFQN